MLRTINKLPSPDDNAQSMEIDEVGLDVLKTHFCKVFQLCQLWEIIVFLHHSLQWSSSQPGPSSSDQNQLILAEANQVLVEDSVSEVSDDLDFSIKIVFVFHTHKTPKTLISDRLLARLYHKRVVKRHKMKQVTSHGCQWKWTGNKLINLVLLLVGSFSINNINIL